jgi:Zn-dependent protease with chaperone function
MLIDALLYDGKSSKEHNVTMDFTFGRRVKIASHNIDVALDDVVIESRLGNTPRVIEFPNGIRCKSEENDKLDQVLLDFNLNKSKTHRIESSLTLMLASVLLTIGFVWFMLTGGANYSANFLANILPQSSLAEVSRITLEQLEENFLEKSKLSTNQERVIQEHFDKLTAGNSHYKLHFRSSPQMGPNAFALPSGDIVLTDQLVALSRDNDFRDILGVLAHEKGHVIEKHSLRMAIKGGIASVIIGYITGDISIIATTIPTILINSSYSRDFEREADAHALKEMEKLGVSTLYMADLFEALAKKSREGEGSSNLVDLMASHPLTSERIMYFRKHAHE